MSEKLSPKLGCDTLKRARGASPAPEGNPITYLVRHALEPCEAEV